MSKNVQVHIPFASEEDASPDAMSVVANERSREMANARESMERLRLLQSELERKHEKLAEIGRKQDAYQVAKRDLLLRLERAMVAMEKQASDTAKAHETIKETCKLFQTRVTALNAIDESGWVGEGFEESLNRAFGLVEEAESVYARGSGKVEALAMGEFAPAAVPQPRAVPYTQTPGGPVLNQSLGFWLKAGFAFTLPLVLAILLLSFLLLYLNGW